MKKLVKSILVFSALAIVLTFLINPQVLMGKPESDSRLAKPNITESQQFDGNRIASWITNNGKIVDNDVTGNSGMEWPKGTNNTIDYASGLWITGKDDSGKVRTACAEYAPEFGPGPILADGTPGDPDDPAYRIYKINSDGTGDWDSWPVDQGAPVDENGDPLLIGDQTMFFVVNDADAANHGNLFNTKPLGVEVQTLVFGFNRSDQLGDIMFVQWTLINKSTTAYDSCFITVWDDPDMGDASDDLVGCDTTLSLGYCYNGSETDATYGSQPPAIGFDFFQGPEVDGEILGMSSFNYFWNGAPDPYGDPENATEAFNFMRGVLSDGSPSIDPITGQPSPFVFSGDPVSGQGWLDSTPADRRFMISSGPFTLAAGDTQVVVGAKIIAQGTSARSSISALKYADQFAQNAFDNDFVVANPEAPAVSSEPLNEKVVLTWDVASKNQAIENFDLLGYEFEGYNIYQGESASGPWHRIGTFDLNNDNAVVYDDVFDVNTGYIVNKPVAYGTNSGLQRHFTVEQDYINNVPLINYKKYYFAVSSYIVNLDATPRVIESGYTQATVVPGTRADVQMPDIDTAETIAVDHTTGVSTAHVTVEVVNPAELTGHNYRIKVNGDAPPWTWDLVDLSDNSTVLANQPLYQGELGEDDPAIADGFKIYFQDTPEPGLSGWDYSGPRWITGVNWGGAQFFGGLDIGANFFGSELGPEDCVPVELRFTTNEEEAQAYYYRRDLGYAFEGVGHVPFTAWDMTDPNNPRQLNICCVEDADVGNGNKIWDLGGWDPATETFKDPDTGGREYVFIMQSSYAPDADLYNDEVDGTVADVLYAMWPTQRGSHPYLEGDWTMQIIANLPLTANDVYEFSTSSKETGAAVAENQIDMINAVPNPYFGYNPAERTPVERIMRFTNLPGDKTTIRIFDLAGNLVRVIDDEARTAQGTNGLAYAEWDLRNSADVPVASGVYLVHFDVENVGTKILKVAVVNRSERLLYY